VQFARALASHGARTVLVARRKDQLDRHVDELTARGLHAMAVAADLTEPEAIARLFDTVECEWGTPTILVNNAGLAQAAKLAEISRKDFGLTWNAVLEGGGVLVGDTVKLEFDVEAVKA